MKLQCLEITKTEKSMNHN